VPRGIALYIVYKLHRFVQDQNALTRKTPGRLGAGVAACPITSRDRECQLTIYWKGFWKDLRDEDTHIAWEIEMSDYKADLLADLKDAAYAELYVKSALRESRNAFLIALKDVADARFGMSEPAERSE